MLTQLISPHPQQFWLHQPGIGGVVKQRPEDFLVEELPLYQPVGQGEHLYLFVEKSNVSHSELVGAMRRHFNVSPESIGFAGMKDKLAVTRQLVSVHLLGEPPASELRHDRIRVLWTARHRNKLRRGHLAGNRFSIRIRQVDAIKAPQALAAITELQRRGVPNYFGVQRFGYRGHNHQLGMMALKGDWAALMAELLGTTGSPFPEYQRGRRVLFEQGRYADSLQQWAAADHAERTALRALAAGKSMRQAGRTIRHHDVGFWINSLQSAVFNRMLDRRIEDGSLISLIEGDLAFRHDRRHVFRVTSQELANPELAGRVEQMEVSPTGPLWGPGMTRAAGTVDQAELDVLQSMGLTPGLFNNPRPGFNGARRSMRARLQNPEVDGGVDEHGPYIRLAFDLDRGAYATVVLREIIGSDQPEATEGHEEAVEEPGDAEHGGDD